MGLISASGIGSNVDIDSIITALLDARRVPATERLNFQEASTQATISGFGALASALDSLKSSLSTISESSDFSKRIATSSNTSFVGVSAGENATPADFSVDVIKLAKGSRLESGLFISSADTVGSGNLTFTAGTQSFSVAIEATDTLSEIRDKINDETGNIGINANIINGDSGTILVLDSSITGTANQLVVTNDDVSLDSISTNLITPAGGAADDAEISVNGQSVTNDTNVFTDAIEDVTITAADITTESVNVSVTLDSGSIKSTIEGFVTAFNEFAKISATLGASDPGAAGVLSGDPTLRIVDRQLRRIVSSAVSGIDTGIASLAELGITTLQDGTLDIDSERLTTAINDNFEEIEQIFISENGISKSLENLVDQYTNNTGVLTTRNTSLNDKLTDINDERLKLGRTLEAYETRLRAQYGAMDVLVARLNSTASFLTTQLANLPGYSQGKNQ